MYVHDLADAELLGRALALPAALHPALEARLDELGGFHGLWHAGSEALGGLLEQDVAHRLEALLLVAGRMLTPPEPAPRIEGASDVAAYFQPRLSLMPCESFWVLMLDARGGVLGAAQVAQGTLTACLVHPREVFAPALRVRAATVIVVHNHPSGDPEPSEEDEELTRRLSDAGLVLGIPVMDHVVVGRGGYRSVSTPTPALGRERLRRGAGGA